MDILFSSDVFASMLRIATPLTLAALGGLLCQRAGVFNIAIEGFMLIGAFASIAVVQVTGGNVWLGMLFAIIAGIFISSIFAFSIIKYKANHIISGIAINMLSLGLTTFLMRTFFHVQGSIRPEKIDKLSPVNIPFIEKIPIIGKALSSQSIITYFSIIMVFVVFVVLFKTNYGLNIRSVGESEEAARTAGVKPSRIRWSVVLISGAFCGLAGSYLSTSIVSEFTENMIQGRGFNAFTAVVFGNAHPFATWLVTLLFGYADAVGIRIELLGTGISPSIIKMFPFILAIVALAISSSASKHKKF